MYIIDLIKRNRIVILRVWLMMLDMVVMLDILLVMFVNILVMICDVVLDDVIFMLKLKEELNLKMNLFLNLLNFFMVVEVVDESLFDIKFIVL